MLRAPWTRRGALELLVNVSLIVALPLLSRVLYPLVAAPAGSLGLGTLLDDLSGRAGFTDIGWEVTATHGLVDPEFSTYDSLIELNPLMGMGAYDFGVQTHPPTSMAMWIPLVPVAYQWWLSFFVMVSLSAIALSMRVMRVPAWVAYPVAVVVALTAVGTFALSSTYPLSALFLALAWTYRDRALIAGCSYAFLAASRGIAVVLLVYPLVRRQWRTLVVAVGIVGGLLLVALAFERTVIDGFVTSGREWINHYASQPDNFTFSALSGRHGLPVGVVWIVSTAVVTVALLRRRELFWALAWFSFAVAPIAWLHSSVGALPMLVVMWQSGRLGRVLTLVVGGALLAILPAATGFQNVGWTVVVVATGVALVACPLGVAAVSPAGNAQLDGSASAVR